MSGGIQMTRAAFLRHFAPAGIPLLLAIFLATSACGSGGATPTAAPRAETAVPAPAVSIIATAPATATAPAQVPTVGSSPVPISSPVAQGSPQPAATAAAAPSTNVGYLEGHADIGPLTPVQRVGVPEPTPSPAVCTSRALAVYEANGTTLVASFTLQSDCSYRVPLSPGSYVVKLKQQSGIGGSKDLPRTVVIEAGKAVRLDISIDTGIR